MLGSALHYHFPGEFAGASLKHKHDALDPAVLRGFPRRIRRGLIEADDKIQPAAERGGFPRRIRRGLIEATCRSASLMSFLANFPGEFAGASLKPEAMDELATAIDHFPGEFAGASLKLGHLDVQDRLLLYFPGEFAGASLKPGYWRAGDRCGA